MKNNLVKISVVTVCFNTVDTIEETILSVINQTYDNIEYIIIDGGSTDGTVDIIKKYSDRIAYWVSEPDKGIYDAMNKGVIVATGDYINFMNAGDTFFNLSVIKNTAFIGDVIYGDAVFKYPKFKLLFKPQPLENFQTFFPIYHQATFIKTILAKENPFNCNYKSSADYDVLRQLYYKNVDFVYSPHVICVFEAVNGLSATNTKLRLYETNMINGRSDIQSNQLQVYRTIIKSCIQSNLFKLFPNIISKLWKKSLLRNDFVFPVEEENEEN